MNVSEESLCVETTSPAETLTWGTKLGEALGGGAIVALVGPLGAGKTMLVKGIAVGNSAGDPRQVVSPTFTLIHEYAGRLVLFHLDAYRLRSAAELAALGFDELIGADSAVAIEWADRVAALVPNDALWIELAVTGDQSRRLTFRATGPTAATCLNALRSAPR